MRYDRNLPHRCKRVGDYREHLRANGARFNQQSVLKKDGGVMTKNWGGGEMPRRGRDFTTQFHYAEILRDLNFARS